MTATQVNTHHKTAAGKQHQNSEGIRQYGTVLFHWFTKCNGNRLKEIYILRIMIYRIPGKSSFLAEKSLFFVEKRFNIFMWLCHPGDYKGMIPINFSDSKRLS